MTEGSLPDASSEFAPDAGQSLWQSCIDLLAQDLPEQQFNTWIKPLTVQVSDDFSKVFIFVANRFKLDWIRAQYSARIASALAQIYGQPVQIELALAPRMAAARGQSGVSITSPRAAVSRNRTRLLSSQGVVVESGPSQTISRPVINSTA